MMISLELVNSPAHLFTAMQASEKIKEIEPTYTKTNGNPANSANLKIAAICIIRIAPKYTSTGIFMYSVFLMNLGTVNTSIKIAGPSKKYPQPLKFVMSDIDKKNDIM